MDAGAAFCLPGDRSEDGGTVAAEGARSAVAGPGAASGDVFWVRKCSATISGMAVAAPLVGDADGAGCTGRGVSRGAVLVVAGSSDVGAESPLGGSGTADGGVASAAGGAAGKASPEGG